MIARSPEAVAAWQRRSRKPLARTKPLRSTRPIQSAEKRKSRSLNRRGPRTKKWEAVWRWLKPKLEKAGRTRCEFEFLEHRCAGPLDPAHSKKRGKMRDNDIYMVAIGCRTVHDFLDGMYVYPPLGRRMNHEDMEEAVMRAINDHGGPIVPA